MTYVYQEYPKAIKGKNGEEVVVRDAAEEAEKLGKSEGAVQREADSRVRQAEDDQIDRDIEEQRRLTEKGTDVTEDEVARLTDLAQKLGPEPKKRGRPSNAEVAARAQEAKK